MKNLIFRIAPRLLVLTALSFHANLFAKEAQLDLDLLCKDLAAKTENHSKSLKRSGYIEKPRRHRKGVLRARTTYRGCEMDLPWIQQVKSALCSSGSPRSFSEAELASINTPEMMLFYIAGAGDFNAYLAETLFNPANLDGREGNDLKGMNWSGRLLNKLFEGLGDSLREQTQIHYYAGSGFKRLEAGASAKACIQDSYRYLKALSQLSYAQTMPKFVLAGYSNGAALSVKYQEDLGNEDVSFDLVFSIDPVPQTHKYLFSSYKSPIGEKHSLTKKLVNVYQTKDFGSMPPLKLRGRSVVNADKNLEINCENWEGGIWRNSVQMDCSGDKNHVAIMYSLKVLDLFIEELRGLF